MLHTTIELSYFSIQLLEYLIENHPHRAEDFDFIKIRGDQAADEYERSLRDEFMQDDAMFYAMDNLYRGLHFSLHNMIKDILWEDFAEFIPARNADEKARLLYPKLKHLHKVAAFDIDNYGRFREIEVGDLDVTALRQEVSQEIRKILTEEYGI